MAKAYIDVPVIGYKTWLIVIGHMENGKFVEDEEDSASLKSLKKDYPYNPENPHVSK